MFLGFVTLPILYRIEKGRPRAILTQNCMHLFDFPNGVWSSGLKKRKKMNSIF